MNDAIYATTSTKLLKYDMNRIGKHDTLSDAAEGHPITVYRNKNGQRQQANEINASNRKLSKPLRTGQAPA